MKKRILACFMAVCMLVCLSVTASAADVTYTDLAGYDWAEEAICRWTDAGVVNGRGENKFAPAESLKRNEAAQVFAKLLKLTEQSDKVFVDVPGTEWYAEAVAKCVKAGITNGMSEDTFEPETLLSREMVMTMLCRALGIEGQETLNGTFEDADKVADWAKGSVYALVNLGYVNGRTATTLAPQESMTRAELMVLLHKVIGTYVTESGVTVQVTGKGVALVLADDVKLEGADFEGSVVVAAAAEVDTAGLPAAKVVATVPGVSVVNATVGTTVTAAAGATGVTVNNTVVEADKSETVTEPVVTPDPVDPTPDEPTEPEEEEKPSIIVHVHTYKNWTCNNDGTHTGTCECGETKTEACDAEVLEAVEATCVTGGLTEGNTGCETCGVKAVEQEEIPATGHDFGTCGHDEEDALKFELSVESGAEVKATVYDDYSAVVKVDGDTVDAATVTVSAKMQNVGSLNVDEMRQHSITVNTGITGHSAVSLRNHLGNAFADIEAEVNIDVAGATFTYEIAGADGVVTATPDDVDDARAAWKNLTKYVKTENQDTDDSSITIANGSYIAVGVSEQSATEGKVAEWLHFETEGNLVLDNVNNIDGLKKTIKEKVAVDVYEEEIGSDVVLFVKAGTKLAVGSSTAELTKDCTIVLADFNDYGDLDGILSDIRSAAQGTTTELVEELVHMINNLIAAINGSTGEGAINVTVSFN